jgi:hypothetical protein
MDMLAKMTSHVVQQESSMETDSEGGQRSVWNESRANGERTVISGRVMTAVRSLLKFARAALIHSMCASPHGRVIEWAGLPTAAAVVQ